jgi:L-alanine-DL-glutamate epimerase-like enolase superfamily enzyme
MREFTVTPESWPVEGEFIISKGACTTAEIVVVEIAEDGFIGRGECERTDSFEPGYPDVAAAIEAARPAVEAGVECAELQSLMPSGSARNAIDCALWDLAAKRAGSPAWKLAGVEQPEPCLTVLTISLGTPEVMARDAARAADRDILKLKLGGEGDIERVKAVRAAVPEMRLTVDANEAWTPDMLPRYLDALAPLCIEFVEQPLPIAEGHHLDGLARPIPIAADESVRDLTSLDAVVGRYDIINIKLDKTGGLTEALALAAAGRAAGLEIMLGCNLGTSLAMAPAMLLTNGARMVDLDGPLLLREDRVPGLRFEGSLIHPPEPALWG